MTRRRVLKVAISASALLLLIFLAARSGDELHSAIDQVGQASLGWLAIGFVASLASFWFAALAYVTLSLRRLAFWSTLLVQYVGGFVNRIVPAGLGGIGLNAYYLTRRGNSVPVATGVTLLNNVIGFVSSLLLVVAFMTWRPFGEIDTKGRTALAVLLGSLVAALLFGILFLLGRRLYVLKYGIRPKRRKPKTKFQTALTQLNAALTGYRRQPWRLAGALLASLGITICLAWALFATAYSLNVHVSLPLCVVVYLVGVLGATILPTPGGIGSSEAGLAAGFVAFAGVPTDTAVAIALLFRLVSFWMPMAIGILALGLARRTRVL